MIPEQCPFFNSCNAPICPLDENKGKVIWYSDEAICKNRDFSDLEYIKTQKKIAKVNKKHSVKGYFTFKMLNRKIIVRSGIQGINDDIPIESLSLSEENWSRRHKPISKEGLEKMRGNVKKAREVLEP